MCISMLSLRDDNYGDIQTPELEILGLTTVFGNVSTQVATGKFGAAFASIPALIIAALYCLFFAYVDELKTPAHGIFSNFPTGRRKNRTNVRKQRINPSSSEQGNDGLSFMVNTGNRGKRPSNEKGQLKRKRDNERGQLKKKPLRAKVIKTTSSSKAGVKKSSTTPARTTPEAKTPEYAKNPLRAKVVKTTSSSKAGVKKSSTVPATPAATTPEAKTPEESRPKRSSRKKRLVFDIQEENEDEYCGVDLSNIPKGKRRKQRINPSSSEQGNDGLSSMLSLVNTGPATLMESEEDIPSESHISQSLGRKRTSIVTRPRNVRSLTKLIKSIVANKRGRIEHNRRGRPPQHKAMKIQTKVLKKKRSQRDPIASQINAKVLDLQWRRQSPQGTSFAEMWERNSTIDAITKLFEELNINREGPCLPHNRETALILCKKAYEEQQALVKYSIQQKPKVQLDPETTREWKLLMLSIDSDGVDGSDEEKLKWWEEERNMFHGRASSFIDRMRCVQGDRTFSPWKGSVVDSVVGVFLTQSVADHASSSAYMDLAAAFPIDWNFNKGSSPEEAGSSVTHETMIDPRIRNPTCVIIEEIDDDEDDTVCSQVSSKTSESSMESILQAQDQEKNTRTEDVRKKVKEYSKKKSKKSAKSKPKDSVVDWDSLRKQAESGGKKRMKTERTRDTADWGALRRADVNNIANIIIKRGMNNLLAERIKAFLNRLVEEHGSIDLEWLRDVAPDKAKEYLLSINGLGLKSVECIRLLSLHQIAFPVDTNVGRIAVRLGWVPLEPLPDELQMHLLELYPVLNSVQKYLWPRLCKLDQKTLYELHYHLITFGKVFCTKKRPNCNACPMKAECRHYASAQASARLALPEPEQSDRTTVMLHEIGYQRKPFVVNFGPSLLLYQEKEQDVQRSENCIPIIEQPASPEPEYRMQDIEDYPWDNKGILIYESLENDPWESHEIIPTIMLNKEAGTSMDLVVPSTAAAIPTRRLKTTEKLRTEHLVYELPDYHPILEGFERREAEDILPYLLAIWAPGETENSIQTPKQRCDFQGNDNTLCHEEKCFQCNKIRKEESQIVRGTILIPCRTGMRGGFPLNGTYFQTNEVFADHGSSINPIEVPRKLIWKLPQRIAYFGSSVSAICKGLTVDSIRDNFEKGYVCVRGFERENRKPKTLVKRLHCAAIKKRSTSILH